MSYHYSNSGRRKSTSQHEQGSQAIKHKSQGPVNDQTSPEAVSSETSFRANKVNRKTEQWNQQKEKSTQADLVLYKQTKIHPKTEKEEETTNITGFPKERRKKPQASQSS